MDNSVIAMLDTSEDLSVCESEIGCPVEQLITPLTRFRRQNQEAHFCIDNGSYKRFLKDGFLSLLDREKDSRHLCRFVAVPDVVAIDSRESPKGDARRTLEVFERWRYKLHGWPLALVAQDGLEDLEIPWDGIEAIFIGGSTDWKLGHAAACVIKAAKALDKWVHVGRVNTPGRFEEFEKLGADSIDGSGLARFSWMRKRIYEQAVRPGLFSKEAN